MLVFQHHSKHFGLYYDVLCIGLVSAGSNGAPRTTDNIFKRKRTVIPIPDEIAQDFLPAEDEHKRLEIRSDILYLSAM